MMPSIQFTESGLRIIANFTFGHANALNPSGIPLMGF